MLLLEESGIEELKNMIVLFLTDNLLSPRIDLQESPMDNPDFILLLFTDGSYSARTSWEIQAGYAVVSPVSVPENGPLPDASSAQEAKLIALTRACQVAKQKSAHIYSNSRYTFGVAHDFGMLWKQKRIF